MARAERKCRGHLQFLEMLFILDARFAPEMYSVYSLPTIGKLNDSKRKTTSVMYHI